jgi:hypothetical protein
MALKEFLPGTSELASWAVSTAGKLWSSPAEDAATFSGEADVEAAPRFKPALRKGNTRRP